MIGYGKMGKNAAEFLQEKGVNIIGIQESEGCVYNRNGLNLKELTEHYHKYKNMMDYVDYLAEDEQIIDWECDILVLATPDARITSENVDLINSKVIIEAANQAISFQAE